MNIQIDQFYETQDVNQYTSMEEYKESENLYELADNCNKGEKSCQQQFPPLPPKIAKQRQSSWSKPLLFIIVLLCLILILLIIILGIVTVVYATGNNVECTNTATGASSSSNTNEWADRIAQNVYDKLNITEGNQKNLNFTELDKQILQTTRDSAQKLINIVNTLSNLQDTSTSTAGVVDDILLIAQELLVLHNDSTPLPTSCKEIRERQPLSPSGVYLLASATTGGATYTAYCNMDELCGSGGGWTRLAYLDMSDATQNCPSGFRLRQSGGVRACGRPGSGCASVQFPSNGISYSQICGRVTGYQYGGTDGLHTNININSYYVEGVSITRGSPRQHVWTLISGYSEASSASYACPCNTGSTVSVQSFIGNNYFCESGSPSSPLTTLYTSDPLWDGQGCGSLESPCCNVPGIPWFHRDYGSTTTTDYIELRVCATLSSEDSPVSNIDIYVK